MRRDSRGTIVSTDPHRFRYMPPEDPAARGQRAPRGRRRAVTVPDQAMVKRVLEGFELKYSVDDDGDLLAPFEDCRVYCMFRGGGDDRTFAVRTFHDTAFTINDKPALLDVIDEWHRRTLWPKAYSHTMDNGDVRVVSEVITPLVDGLDQEYFTLCVGQWISAAVDFDTWLIEETRGRA
ncbi:MAG: YbjN domain-containing protein [Streptosporangiales bacterium]|nr:YbjN domain-containing protein [Streptosporangiales bacterium]